MGTTIIINQIYKKRSITSFESRIDTLDKKIEKLEKETLELQTQRFGLNGDYFMKRQELIKPIQDRVYEAMQEVSSKRNYSFVFDKANQSNLVYADSKYDISDSVLKEMGVTSK